MTFRKVLIRLLDNDISLDDNILIRLVERNKEGSVVRAKTVPVNYTNIHGYLCVEIADINNAKWED